MSGQWSDFDLCDTLKVNCIFAVRMEVQVELNIKGEKGAFGF